MGEQSGEPPECRSEIGRDRNTTPSSGTPRRNRNKQLKIPDDTPAATQNPIKPKGKRDKGNTEGNTAGTNGADTCRRDNWAPPPGNPGRTRCGTRWGVQKKSRGPTPPIPTPVSAQPTASEKRDPGETVISGYQTSDASKEPRLAPVRYPNLPLCRHPRQIARHPVVI